MVVLGESEKRIIAFDIVFDKHSNSCCYNHVGTMKHNKETIDFVESDDSDFKCVDKQRNVKIIVCPDNACVENVIVSCLKNGHKTIIRCYPSIIDWTK